MITPFHLDIPTIIFLLFIGNLVSAAMLAVVTKASVKHPYKEFLAGKLLQSCGWLLIVQRGNIADVYSVYLGNITLLLGFTAEFLALTSSDGTIRHWRKIFWSIGVLGSMLFLCTAAWMPLRIASASIALVILLGTSGVVMFSDRHASSLRRMTGFLNLLLAGILIGRATLSLCAAQTFELFDANAIQILSFIPVYLVMLTSGIGFVLLSKERADNLLLIACKNLDHLAYTDGLTNIANRRGFDEALNHTFRDCRRRNEKLALLFIDIDYFKEFNDHTGHLAGDACLRSVGLVLQQVCQRSRDYPARYGGEEFAVILPNTPPQEVVSIAETIRERIATLNIPHPASPIGNVITASIGIAIGSPSTDGYQEDWYIDTADQNLYRAKSQGRNRVVA